jgi:hypothetical protein
MFVSIMSNNPRQRGAGSSIGQKTLTLSFNNWLRGSNLLVEHVADNHVTHILDLSLLLCVDVPAFKSACSCAMQHLCDAASG